MPEIAQAAIGWVIAIVIIALMIRTMFVLFNDDDTLQYALEDLLSALVLVSFLGILANLLG